MLEMTKAERGKTESGMAKYSAIYTSFSSRLNKSLINQCKTIHYCFNKCVLSFYVDNGACLLVQYAAGQ